MFKQNLSTGLEGKGVCKTELPKATVLKCATYSHASLGSEGDG